MSTTSVLVPVYVDTIEESKSCERADDILLVLETLRSSSCLLVPEVKTFLSLENIVMSVLFAFIRAQVCTEKV